MFEKLKAEIKLANGKLHEIAKELKKDGITYPKFIFHDDLNFNKIKTERDIVKYLVDKKELVMKYNSDMADKYQIDILNPIQGFEIWTIFRNVYGEHRFIIEYIMGIIEDNDPIDDFIDYLYLSQEEDEAI